MQVLWQEKSFVLETLQVASIVSGNRTKDIRIRRTGNMEEGTITRGFDFDAEADPPTIVVILMLDDC